jgi:hypothetical protein
MLSGERLTPTETPNEYRMLIVRATMAINAHPELEMALILWRWPWTTT